MALQTAAVLYPLKTTAVDTSGANIYELKDTEPGSTDFTSSIRNATKNTTVERTFNPGVGSSTDNNDASTTNNTHGWAVPVADMAVDALCTVDLVAQTVTVNMHGFATSTGLALANDTYTPKASLWKWNPTTNTATLIVGGSGTPLSKNGQASAYTGSAWAAVVTLSLPATSFAAGELLMLVLGGTLFCANAVAGHTTDWQVDLDVSTTKVTFGTSGLRQTGSGTGTITAATAATDTGTPGRQGTSTLTAPTAFTATGIAGHRGTSTITASAVVTGAGGHQASTTGTITAATGVTATGVAARHGTSTTAATTSVTSSGTPARAGNSTVTAATVVTGDGGATHLASGTIIIVSTVTGSGVAAVQSPTSAGGGRPSRRFIPPKLPDLQIRVPIEDRYGRGHINTATAIVGRGAGELNKSAVGTAAWTLTTTIAGAGEMFDPVGDQLVDLRRFIEDERLALDDF